MTSGGEMRNVQNVAGKFSQLKIQSQYNSRVLLRIISTGQSQGLECTAALNLPVLKLMGSITQEDFSPLFASLLCLSSNKFQKGSKLQMQPQTSGWVPLFNNKWGQPNQSSSIKRYLHVRKMCLECWVSTKVKTWKAAYPLSRFCNKKFAICFILHPWFFPPLLLFKTFQICASFRKEK